MPDKMTREQRHRCMASIRGRDTKPTPLAAEEQVAYDTK